jgi:hypothetical protein
MAVLPKNDAGVVLTGQFTRGSSTAEAELDAFRVKLTETMKRLSFTSFVHSIEEKGTLVTIRIVPVQVPPSGRTANAGQQKALAQAKPAKVGWGSK